MVRRRDAGEEQLGGSHYSWDDRCGLGGFLCYEYGSDSDTATNMANNIFVALLIAWAVAVVCGYAAKAGGRTRWSFYWVGALMVALCCVQYYFVFLSRAGCVCTAPSIKAAAFASPSGAKGESQHFLRRAAVVLAPASLRDARVG